MNSLKKNGVSDLERVKDRARKLAAFRRIRQSDADKVVRRVDDLIAFINELEEETVEYGETISHSAARR